MRIMYNNILINTAIRYLIFYCWIVGGGLPTQPYMNFISIYTVEMVKYSRRKGKSSRKGSRKGRKSSRKGANRISRKMRMLMMRGGAQLYSPAGVDDASMMSSSKMNLAQGSDYQEIHANQHGGAAFDLNSSAPVGYTGVLDQSLRATAHLGPLDASLDSIRGMSDQSGGARRKKSGKFSKASKAATRRAVAAIKKLKNMFKKMAKRGRAMMSRKKQRGGKMCGGKMYGGQMNMPPKMMGGQMNEAPKMMGGQMNKMYGGQMNKMYGGQMNEAAKMMGGQMNKMYGGQMNKMYGGQMNKMYGGQMNKMYGGQMNKMMGGNRMYGGQMNEAPKMMGGARRKAGKLSKASKAATRRAVAAIKKLKNMFKKMAKRGRAMLSRKKQRGGSASSLTGAADYSSPGMLLSPAMENRALLGMHTQEWKLAADPTSFAPKMA
jgi:hypothetical protein